METGELGSVSDSEPARRSHRAMGVAQSCHLELVFSLDCKQRSLRPWGTEGPDSAKFLTEAKVMARRKKL